jgi:hypothetical protein
VPNATFYTVVLFYSLGISVCLSVSFSPLPLCRLVHSLKTRDFSQEGFFCRYPILYYLEMTLGFSSHLSAVMELPG